MWNHDHARRFCKSEVCLAVLLVCSLVWLACTPAQQLLVRDTTGAACALVLQATEPALAPLCTTLPELEAVIEEWAASRKAAGAPSSPAAYPTQNELYQLLSASRKRGIR